MGEARLRLPPALESARRFVLVRYADYQDVRAGRTAEVAARVARRGRRLRLWVLAGLAFLIAPDLLQLAYGSRPGLGALYLLLAVGSAVVALTRAVARLDELAGEPATGAAAAEGPDPRR